MDGRALQALETVWGHLDRGFWGSVRPSAQVQNLRDTKNSVINYFNSAFKKSKLMQRYIINKMLIFLIKTRLVLLIFFSLELQCGSIQQWPRSPEHCLEGRVEGAA